LTTGYGGTTLGLYGLELLKTTYGLESCRNDSGVSGLPAIMAVTGALFNLFK